MNLELIRNFGILTLAVLVLCLLLGLTLAGIALFKLRKLDVPLNASFVETLYYTPLLVVVAVDLLDLAFDFLAAPISWTLLDRLGLKALRGVSTVEALIPGTQLIPTMTLCWIGVRLLRFTGNQRLQIERLRQSTY
jgi:hypothetical protein